MVVDLCFHVLFRAGFVLDNEDRSITRSDLYFRELFSRCGLHVYKAKVNIGFGLCAHRLYLG